MLTYIHMHTRTCTARQCCKSMCTRVYVRNPLPFTQSACCCCRMKTRRAQNDQTQTISSKKTRECTNTWATHRLKNYPSTAIVQNLRLSRVYMYIYVHAYVPV